MRNPVLIATFISAFLNSLLQAVKALKNNDNDIVNAIMVSNIGFFMS